MSHFTGKLRAQPALQLSYEQAQNLLRVLDHTRVVLENFVGQNQPQDSVGTSASASFSGRWGREGRSWWAYHCFPDRRRSVAKYIFIITLLLQAMNLLVVTLIDRFPKQDDTAVYGTGITMILLQLLNLSFIIMVSMRLVRQLSKHKVSLLLLAQSYLSTIMLFAGIYTLTFRLEAKSWQFIQENTETDPLLVFELYSKFLFFSVSTATLCGSDNVLPKYWYNCLFASVQMLLSFIYFASILGHTLSQDTQYWLGVGLKTSQPTLTQAHRLGGTDDTTSPTPAALQDQDCSSAEGGGVPSGVSRRSAGQNYCYGSDGHSVVTFGSPLAAGGRRIGDGMEGNHLQSVTVDMEVDTSRSINCSPFPVYQSTPTA
ncbi:hypothetical protein ACOMHN_000258 [Nucella lapillus]